MTITAEAPAAEATMPGTSLAARTLTLLRAHWAVPAVAALSLWITVRHPMSFDGSMNLQVAQSVEAGRGYARHYHVTTYFPIEIQTNGPILLLGALLIAVFGQHNLVYQLPNIICMVALVAIASTFVKGRYANLLLFLCVLGLPELVQFGYSGYGEIPLAMLELAVIVLAAKGVAARRPRLLELAAFLAGIAVVTKVVGVAVIVPLAAAVLWYLKDDERRARTLARLVAALALGPVLWEIYRFVVFGTFGEWKQWWRDQLDGVLFQSGADKADQLPIQHAVWQRLGTLANAFESGRMTVAVLLVGGVAALAWAAWRIRRSPEQRETFVIRLGLATMVATYFAWWFFITPDEKAWLRRVLIALLFLLIGLAHLVADAVADARRRGWAFRPDLAALALGLGLLLVGPLAHNARLVWQGDDTELRVVDDAAAFVAAQPDDARFFGVGWWSAPVISAYSQRDFLDLQKFDTCTLRPEGEYFVLDRYITLIAFPEPPLEQFRVTGLKVYDFGGNTTIWQIGPPADCPTG